MPCALEVRGARIQNRVPPHAIFVGCVYFDKTSAFHEGEQVVVYVDDTFVLDDLGAVVRPAKVTSFDGARKVFSPYIFLTRQK